MPSAVAAAPTRDAVASIAGLAVEFGPRERPVRALRGVDLTLAPGEIVGLVGESGSGKTVLGLSLLGLLPSTARIDGSVVVDGIDMVRADAEAQRRVRRASLGAVFQDPMSSLNPTMRLGRQVVEVAGSEAEAVRLLRAVGIADADRRLRVFPHELSGGLRQRAMLAMAVAGSPKLVVADEPTTALDVTVQAQVLAQFRKLRDEIGCAFLLITHDLAVAASVADRLCVMYAGRVVELGRARAVSQLPAHPYTASLLTSRITLAAERSRMLPSIPGEPPDPREPLEACAFAPRCPAARPPCREKQPQLLAATVHDGSSACHFEAGPAVARSTETPIWARRTVARGGLSAMDVVVRFGGRRLFHRVSFDALHGVSVDVEPGESVGLVGGSGSGKTTFMRVLAGLQRPTAGRVEYRGGRPQMVFQDAGSSLTPWLRVGELLDERVRALPARERRARTEAVLVRLGLSSEVLRARPRELSGGQRQRIALARAVIEPPDVLLCDEPISALDASLAATVLNLLGELRRELGFSMVFVTHDLAAARLVSDRILVMTDGRIVEGGETEQVLAAPTTDYTRDLLAAVPEVPSWS